MRIDVVTLFPKTCKSALDESIVARGRKNGYVQICFHQLRDYAQNKHKTVDDTPFGGGKGMLLKPEPIANCFETLFEHLNTRPHIIYMSPKGKVLNQEKVKTLTNHNNLIILCGHYEGVDQRIIDEYVDEEISCGDYVLTGGELPAAILIDAVTRMKPGVLSDDICFSEESHFDGLLEHPQYTRPVVFRGREVPKVLLSGNHKDIENWKKQKSIEATNLLRPDLLKDKQD